MTLPQTYTIYTFVTKQLKIQTIKSPFTPELVQETNDTPIPDDEAKASKEIKSDDDSHTINPRLEDNALDLSQVSEHLNAFQIGKTDKYNQL